MEQMLDLFLQNTQRCTRQQLALAGPHGDVPSDRQLKVIRPLLDTLVVRISKVTRFVTMP